MLLRKDASGGDDPTYDLELWETGGGSALATLASGVTLSSDTGTVVSVTWDATSLGTADGSLVELRIVGTASTGTARAVEVGAVEWISRAADEELYFLRARYYDPEIGRFAGRDPVPFNQRYAYVGNNPVLYSDASGANPFGACAGPAGATVATSETGVGLVAGGTVTVVCVATIAGIVYCTQYGCDFVAAGGAAKDWLGGVGGAIGDVAEGIGDKIGGLFQSSRDRRKQALKNFEGIFPQYQEYLSRYDPCHPYADSFFDRQIMPFYRDLVKYAETAGIEPPAPPARRDCGPGLAIPLPTHDFNSPRADRPKE